ncbi:MAG: hypothetical protein EOP09_06470, partial [Proteobacteria bacterium]
MIVALFALTLASLGLTILFFRLKKEIALLELERRKFAHDLQSPIAALRSLGKNAKSLNDPGRALLSEAILRLEILAGVAPQLEFHQDPSTLIQPEIHIPLTHEIWSIDDDTSIHEIWKLKRIEGARFRYF